MTPTKEIIKTEPIGQLPASFGNIQVATDLTMAKAELLQGLSKKLKPESGFEDLRIGMIVNSVTGAVLPETFVPFYVHREFIEEKEVKKGLKEIVFKTTNPNDPYVVNNSTWTEKIIDGENKRIPPKVQPWLTVFALFGDKPDRPLTILFKNTSLKAGTNLLDIAYGEGGELYSHSYDLSSVLHKNGQNYIYNVTMAGATPKALIELAQQSLAGVSGYAATSASSAGEEV